MLLFKASWKQEMLNTRKAYSSPLHRRIQYAFLPTSSPLLAFICLVCITIQSLHTTRSPGVLRQPQLPFSPIFISPWLKMPEASQAVTDNAVTRDLGTLQHPSILIWVLRPLHSFSISSLNRTHMDVISS